MAEGRRQALLIATDTYTDPGLGRLRAPTGDVGALGKVLADPEIGDFDVRELINRPTDELKGEIEEFFADARLHDLLLLYVSGHGVLSQRGRLYLATRTTDRRRLLTTGIEDRFVVDVMEHGRARSIALILDCCHSGAFAKGLAPKSGTDVGVAQRFQGQGRVTLTASSELEYAFEETEESDDVKELGAAAPGSLFTRYIVEGLRTGEADINHDGDISIDELYDYVYARVREQARNQTPVRGGVSHGDIVIARSIRDASLPAEFRQGLTDARSWVREATIDQLARQRETAEPRLTAAIEDALRRAVDDDSRRVAAAARAALQGTRSATHVEQAAPAPATAPSKSPSPASAEPRLARRPEAAPALHAAQRETASSRQAARPPDSAARTAPARHEAAASKPESAGGDRPAPTPREGRPGVTAAVVLYVCLLWVVHLLDETTSNAVATGILAIVVLVGLPPIVGAILRRWFAMLLALNVLLFGLVRGYPLDGALAGAADALLIGAGVAAGRYVRRRRAETSAAPAGRLGSAS